MKDIFYVEYNNIYIISNKNDSLIGLITLDEIKDKYISIISYKSSNSLFYCIINYINDNNTLISKIYSYMRIQIFKLDISKIESIIIMKTIIHF